MAVVAGARKVSTYAQRAAASLDEKLVSQERPRVQKEGFGLRWVQPRKEPHQPLAPKRRSPGPEQPPALRAIAIAA